MNEIEKQKKLLEILIKKVEIQKQIIEQLEQLEAIKSAKK